jgi:PTH1 family peptidyl-tRNA hydrolase
MLLLVGLGNPGSDYAGHRHNVGFMAVDAIHRRHGFPPWRRRFQAEVAEGTLAGDKVLLLKPQTYMNESGRSVGAASGFYKLAPADVLVIHDEVDLPPGKTRMKVGGGAAGHNGLRSVTAAIGDGYRRLRIGVGHPGVKERVPGYVLHDFAKADRTWLEPLLEAIADHAALLAEGKDATFANRLHAATGEGESKKAKKPAADGDRPAKAAGAAAGSDGPPASKLGAAGKPAPAPSAPTEGPLARGLKRLFGGKGE